eukprot:TRINITY_DN99189_c0_g1_i1.p1 TRINITY_DN99189_c0_g1~~TRINITY_DN99189_c0_g1_i1.p1  ORF type:complete len:124 (+),score=24.24 TRINITY_DN99189_c0_g1_i1:78-449(+)
MADVELGEGDAIEAYWPHSDEWLPATLTTMHKDGSLGITWEDGCLSDVPADYVRIPALVDSEDTPKPGAGALGEVGKAAALPSSENSPTAVDAEVVEVQSSPCTETEESGEEKVVDEASTSHK